MVACLLREGGREGGKEEDERHILYVRSLYVG